MTNHARRFRGFADDSATMADPNVATNRISLQQLILEDRAALQALADHMSSDVKQLAGAVVALQRQSAQQSQLIAALQNQLLAASKGMNVSFTRLAQQPQIGPFDVGVPTHALRPQSVNINSPGALQTAQVDTTTQQSDAEVQGAMSDADQIFYSGGDE